MDLDVSFIVNSANGLHFIWAKFMFTQNDWFYFSWLHVLGSLNQTKNIWDLLKKVLFINTMGASV